MCVGGRRGLSDLSTLVTTQVLILEEASQWPGELLESMYELCLKLVEINPVFMFMMVCDPDQLPAVNGSPIHLSTASSFCGRTNGRAARPVISAALLLSVRLERRQATRLWTLSRGLCTRGLGEDVLVAAAVNLVADKHNAACLLRLNPATPTMYEAKDVVEGVDKTLDLHGKRYVWCHGARVVVALNAVLVPIDLAFRAAAEYAYRDCD